MALTSSPLLEVRATPRSAEVPTVLLPAATAAMAGDSLAPALRWLFARTLVLEPHCDDQTIGYHFAVSSPEPFYCSPRGGVDVKQNGVDVISCASPFYGSKGAYASSGVSYYPPRADLSSFVADHDGPDAMAFSTFHIKRAGAMMTPLMFLRYAVTGDHWPVGM